MLVKSILSRSRSDFDGVLKTDVLIERLRKLRALNSKPERIGLTEYTWRSFSIDKVKVK